MSENTKFLLKPKVRFSQSSDTEQEVSNEQMKTGKPKIKNVVTIKRPIRIVKKNEKSDFSNVLKEKNEKPSEQWNKPLRLCSSTENDKNTLENKKMSCDVNVAKANRGSPQNENSPIGIPLRDNTDTLQSSKASNAKLLQEKDTLIPHTQTHLKHTASKDSKSKENQKLAVRQKNSKTVNLMPCHKYKQIIPKTKTSLVKKTVVRDIYGQNIKPYIGPGVPREKRDSETPKTEEKKVQAKPDIISSERLARPEYNSIMCTINKLNEVKNEKIVTDIAHLPQSYKSLINGKVSSTLDFPMSEAIYKNLVDLSIDEKQLPNRLMRTKDPEPRQKDIVPSLSDFFTPFAIEEEYCVPVSVKPRIPEVNSNWNAFAISDKILEWKYKMDNE